MRTLFNKYLSLLIPVFALLWPSSAEARNLPGVMISGEYNQVRFLLLGIAIVLFVLIVIQTIYLEMALKDRINHLKEKAKKNSGQLKQQAFLLLMPATLPFDVVLISIVILLELIVIAVLWSLQYQLKAGVVSKKVEVEEKKVWWKRFINWFGADNTEEDIKRLDLHHDYDGISELDNPIPMWWNLAFAATCLISLIYFIRFVSGDLPDQIEELEHSQMVAEAKVKEYLEKTGGAIDENTVTLSDAAGIEDGKENFQKSCIACHGVAGEGGIGPNLTDDYWLHGGDLKDVFYSIKYGWPEKGMQSWKDDYSPIEIANLASYIKSIRGTEPANAKEPEGDLYEGD